MKVKNLNPVERHVEKIALAVTAAAAGYFIWVGFVQPPAVVPNPTASTQTLTPAEVEPAVTAAVEKLKQGIDKPEQIKNPNLPDYVKLYLAGTRDPLPRQLVDASVPLIGPLQVPPGNVGDTGPKSSPIATPSVPAPENGDIEQKRHVVLVPTAAAAPGGAPPRVAAANPGGFPTDMAGGFPGGPPGANPANPNAVPTTPTDMVWVKVLADYPVLKLQKEFAGESIADPSKRLPPEYQRIVFYRVEAQRQEIRGDGTRGEWLDVPPAKCDQPPTLDLNMVQEQQLGLALDQIALNYLTILEPTFYQLVDSDTNAGPAREATNASAQDLDTIARTRKQTKAARPNTPPPFSGRGGPGGPGGGPGGPGGGYPGGMTPEQMQRMMRGGAGPGTARGPGRGQPGASPGGFPGPNDPGLTPPPMPLPGGPAQQAAISFDELLKKETFPIWFFDETVKPGARYQYRLRVVVYNPTFKLTLPLQNPQDRQQPWLQSAWYTDPKLAVTIGQNQYFFATGPGSNPGTVDVKIFKWVKGVWVQHQEDVAPGQSVGHMADATVHDAGGRISQQQVDFTTGYTLVDVNADGNNGLAAVLLSPDGQLIRRSTGKDAASPKLIDLNGQIQKQGLPSPSAAAQ